MSTPVKKLETTSGKTLEYRESTPSDVLSLLEIADFNPTPSWLKYALMVCSVESIDGIPVETPQNKIQIKQIADKLGSDGISALFDALYPAPQKEDATENPAYAEREQAKN